MIPIQKNTQYTKKILFLLFALLFCFEDQLLAQTNWLAQDFSKGYGLLKLGGKNQVGRFGGGSWGKINGADFDNDGDIDIVSSFGFGGGAVGTYSGLYLYQNIGSPENALLDKGFKLSADEDMPLIGDANNDSKPDIYCNGFLFLNKSTKEKIQFFAPKPFANPNWPAPSVCDWNRDGIADEFLDDLWHLKVKYGKTKQIEILQVGGSDLLDDIFIEPFPCDWDADGDLDILVGQESGHLTFVKNDNGRLLAEKYIQQQNPNIKSGCLSIPVICDWDGDGDNDIITGNAAGYVEYFENKNGGFNPAQRLKAGGKEIRVLAGPFGSVQGAIEARWGYVNPEVADWDLDGDLDVLAGCVSGENLYYENIGTRTHPKLDIVKKLKVDWGQRPPAFPEGMRYGPEEGCLITQWRCKPVVMDWTKDGLPDYLTIDFDGRLACYPRFRRKNGTLGLLPAQYPFVDENNNPLQFCAHEKPGRNGRIKFALVDWDSDGDLDIIRNGGLQNGTKNLDDGSNFVYLECIGVDKNKAIFKWQGELVPSLEIRLQGHTDSPFPYDVDGNGTIDLISGCEDGNVYYFLREYIDSLNNK